ncbi:glycosyltransferase family 4 protein [Patescibacteria group bacterium]|nr:glycosyltransferase family 4 protein [Patescibacteria group bacterium]
MNRKLRIGIDARPLFVEKKTGIEVYLTNLLRELREVDTQNEYLLFTHKIDSKNIVESNNFKYITVNGPNFAWPQLSLARYLKKNQDDIDVCLFTHHSIPLRSPVKTVAVILDLAFIDYKEYFPYFSYLLNTKLTTNFTVKKADHLVAISQQTKKDILTHYQVDEKKIDVIYLGFNSKKYHPRGSVEISSVLNKYHIKNDYVLYVGTMQKRKNLINLLKAFAVVKKSKPSMQMVFAGKKGWFFEEIQETVRKEKLVDSVMFLGYVPENDLPALYSGSKVFALVSLYEGFGIPLLEAMACGCPVITSNISSLPEVAGDAGVLIHNPHDYEEIAKKLIHVLSDQKLLSEMSKKSLSRAKEFSWKKCAAETLNTLTHVANS